MVEHYLSAILSNGEHKKATLKAELEAEPVWGILLILPIIALQST